MQKTKIEWCDYTWNPIKGYCPNTCPYCYSHRIYNRFGWDKTVRFDSQALKAIKSIKKPSRIFIGSMIEMYHPTVPDTWVNRILLYSCDFPQHTFITLTKFPCNLYKYYFPIHWWLGVTIDSYNENIDNFFMKARIARINFLSFEPLLSSMGNVDLQHFDWIIIGGLTPKPVHKKDWIDDIVARADDLGIPVFIKKNAQYPIKREEFPASGKRAG